MNSHTSQEEAFAREFLDHNGLDELVEVITCNTGNTLAVCILPYPTGFWLILVQYALTAMQNLMELDYGWASLTDDFILKIVRILASPRSLINVCRPATAILKKLVEADPSSASGPLTASSSRGTPAPNGSVYRYGFQAVFVQMRKERGSLETVVNRLGSAEMAMAQYRWVHTKILEQPVIDMGDSMMLINSLLVHASDDSWEEFIAELERLNVRKAVVVCLTFYYGSCVIYALQRLMSLHNIEDLTSCMDFQANMVRVTYRKKITMVDPTEDPSHAAVLSCIWDATKLREEVDANGQSLKWRKIGFDTEDMVQEFAEVGVLGLECLVSRRDPLQFPTTALILSNRRSSLKAILISPWYGASFYSYVSSNFDLDNYRTIKQT